MLTDTVNDVLYVGGQFYWLSDTIMSPGVAKWNGTTFEPVGCLYGAGVCVPQFPITIGLGQPVTCLALYNGELFAGGEFNHWYTGDTTRFVARFDGVDWHPAGYGMDGPVRSLKVFNDTLYASGWFSYADGQPCGGMAKWTGNGWVPAYGAPIFSTITAPLNYVRDMEIVGDSVYVGGNFNNPFGSFTWSDGSGWMQVEDGLTGQIAEIFQVANINGEIVVAGAFALPPWGSANNPGSGILKTDGHTWTEIGDGTRGADNPVVRRIMQWGNDLLAIGPFDRMGGVPSGGLSKWDGYRWCSMLPPDYLDNIPGCMAVFRDTLYIGGGFWTAGGDSINYIAKWVGGNYVDTCGWAVGLETLAPTTEFGLFPNPTTGSLRIRGPVEAGDRVEVFDAVGRLVISAANAMQPISAHALAKGTYAVRLHRADQPPLVIGRFIRQ